MTRVALFFCLIFCLVVNNTFAQNVSHSVVTQVSANRFALAHNFGYELDAKKNKFGIYLGYNPDRLFRFNHFAVFSKLNYSRALIANEKMNIYSAFDVVGNFRAYPSNSDLSILSAYGGYALTYGRRWQLVQSLSLGLSQFIVPEQGFVTHDFLVMFGLRYRIHED